MTNFIIPRCYDSHVHWAATGEVSLLLNLSQIKSLVDLNNYCLNKKPNRGNWIVGFGWDQSQWDHTIELHHKILDPIFPNNPVALIRSDGHALWLNSMAMQTVPAEILNPKFQVKGGRIERDQQGLPNGIFVDAVKDLIEVNIPKISMSEIKNHLLLGQEIFFKSGFTHIRDVGGCLTHWEIARELEQADKLDLYVEMYFNLEREDDLSLCLQDIVKAQRQSSYSKHLRMGGLKLYYDGALGSEGAYLSRPYSNGQQGLRMYELAFIEEVLHRCWEQKIPVAIHTLGDEAVHQVVSTAIHLKQRGIEGSLNLEHCEVVRPETITLMKALDLCCHLQPSHFLSDRRWLKEKLGELYSFVFPWSALQQAGISMCFGSDSPIEKPSLETTFKALQEAAKEEIPYFVKSSKMTHELKFENTLNSLTQKEYIKDLIFYHSHPDSRWGAEYQTVWDGKSGVHINKVKCK